MRWNMRKNIALALVLIAAPCLVTGQTRDGGNTRVSDEVQELILIDQKWSQAEVQGNTEVLDLILAGNFIDSNAGRGRKKSQLIADIASGALKFESITPEGYNPKIHADTATVMYQATVRGQNEGLDISGRYAITHVYQRVHGRWQAVASYRRLISRPPAGPPSDRQPVRPAWPAAGSVRPPLNVNPYILLAREAKARRSFLLRFRPTQLDPKAAARAEVAVRDQSLLVRVRANNLPLPSSFGERRYTLWAYLPEERQRVYLGDVPVMQKSRRERRAGRGRVDSAFHYSRLRQGAAFGGLLLSAEPPQYVPLAPAPRKLLLAALTPEGDRAWHGVGAELGPSPQNQRVQRPAPAPKRGKRRGPPRRSPSRRP
jgi:hypothetical protein